MPFELSFDVREGSDAPSRDALVAYFGKRSHYTLQHDGAAYRNEDTGVAFGFLIQRKPLLVARRKPKASAVPAKFFMNLLRPRPFVTEAQPELEAFVERFDLSARLAGDPDFTLERFAAAWQEANERVHPAEVSSYRRRGAIVATADPARIESVWRWNRDRAKRQRAAGEGCHVPRIDFAWYGGAAVTIAQWIPTVATLLPDTDLVAVATTTTGGYDLSVTESAWVDPLRRAPIVGLEPVTFRRIAPVASEEGLLERAASHELKDFGGLLELSQVLDAEVVAAIPGLE